MSRKDLYKSKTWKEVRKYIWLKQSCLCARCGRPVYVSGLTDYLPKEKRLKSIVHHKEYLNEESYTDIDIAFNEDNLEGLCIDCHNSEHFKNELVRDGLEFNEIGELVERIRVPRESPHV